MLKASGDHIVTRPSASRTNSSFQKKRFHSEVLEFILKASGDHIGSFWSALLLEGRSCSCWYVQSYTVRRSSHCRESLRHCFERFKLHPSPPGTGCAVLQDVCFDLQRPTWNNRHTASQDLGASSFHLIEGSWSSYFYSAFGLAQPYVPFVNTKLFQQKLLEVIMKASDDHIESFWGSCWKLLGIILLLYICSIYRVYIKYI